jgi:uncharacterized tellurite resistance protein B-like protein
MTNPNVIKNLAKVMVAAAWADGNITLNEMNCLKDLLFNLPGMTAHDWAEIDIYVESPVDEAERRRLVAELEASLSSREDKNLALQALDQLAQMDGGIDATEQIVVDELRSAILNDGAGGAKGWSLFSRNRVKSRAQVVQDAPNRELQLDDFIQNKIYYNVSRRFSEEKFPVQLSTSELRKLSLAGGLLARVAYADRQVTEQETQVIVNAIQQHWGVSEVEARVVAEMAASEVSKGMDYYRLTRQFFEVTTEEQRLRFLDTLFVVAAGDGQASFAEIEEIRAIASGFLLSHRQFIDAKLKVSREQRID